MFQRAAEGKRGEEALDGDGRGVRGAAPVDRARLRAQMQAYAACDDPEICDVVRNGYGDIVAYVERVSGLPAERRVALLRHRDADERLASMDLWDPPEPWSQRLLAGCRKR